MPFAKGARLSQFRSARGAGEVLLPFEESDCPLVPFVESLAPVERFPFMRERLLLPLLIDVPFVDDMLFEVPMLSAFPLEAPPGVPVLVEPLFTFEPPFAVPMLAVPLFVVETPLVDALEDVPVDCP